MTILDIIGIMYFWDLSLDSVNAVNLVLAVGFSVDYTAHIAHCFMVPFFSNFCVLKEKEREREKEGERKEKERGRNSNSNKPKTNNPILASTRNKTRESSKDPWNNWN